MNSLQQLGWNDLRENNIIPSSEITEKKGEIADFPLGGRLHPVTRNHHQTMKGLRTNEIRFTVTDLLQMLDDPSKGHLTKDYMNLNEVDKAQSYPTPRIPKGISMLNL